MHTGDPSLNDEVFISSTDTRRNPMADWLAAATDVVEVHRGDILQGTIVSIAPTEILIDVGCKADGLVAGRELERMTGEDLASVHVGDCLPVLVLHPEDRDGNILLSITRARAMRDWQTAEDLLNSQQIFEAVVGDCNKGGVIVNIGRLRGFIPASQLTSEAYERAGTSPDDDRRWQHLLRKKLRLKVIEVDRARNRLILSERAAIREWRQNAKQKLLEELQVGEVRKGTVTSLCDFGAFVDLGGADGLVHLSELSWERVNHPRECLKEGQEVEVYVLDVDREKQRIGLSRRRLMPEPQNEMSSEFQVGQIVTGVITKVVNFGAFARIGENSEGLIHISELAEGRINHPHEVVREGDVIPLKVIRIDSDRRRIGLSLRQAQDGSDVDWRLELESSRREEETAEGL